MGVFTNEQAIRSVFFRIIKLEDLEASYIHVPFIL